MKMQIDIIQSRGRNLRIVLRGHAGGEAREDDSDVFGRYIEVCRAFAPNRALLPEVPADAFDAEGEPRVVSPASR